MEHLLQKSKCSIFRNIFKYMIFQRQHKALLWSQRLIIILLGIQIVWCHLTLCPLGKFSRLFVSAVFFSKSTFSKNSFRNMIECQTIWIQNRPDILSGLIWYQTICKTFQQTTLGDKDLQTHSFITVTWKIVTCHGSMFLNLLFYIFQ